MTVGEQSLGTDTRTDERVIHVLVAAVGVTGIRLLRLEVAATLCRSRVVTSAHGRFGPFPTTSSDIRTLPLLLELRFLKLMDLSQWIEKLKVHWVHSCVEERHEDEQVL